MSHTDWSYIIETNAEDVTLHHLTEVEVDTSSYPTNDFSDSSSTIKMFASSWMDMPRVERVVRPQGQFSMLNIFGIVKRTTTIAAGDWIERSNGMRYDVLNVYEETTLTKGQYYVVRLARRDLE